jgi:hypothetical protein
MKTMKTMKREREEWMVVRDTKMCEEKEFIILRFEVFAAVTMKNGVFWDVRRVALVRTDVSEELSSRRASVASYS